MTIAPPVERTLRTTADETVFQNRFVTLTDTPVRFPDQTEGRHAKVTSGTGFGGITVPRYVFRGTAYYGLVIQHRFAVDQETFEFPRGTTSDLGDTEALRELFEETGVDAGDRRASRIGSIFPDTGLLTTEVGVWVVTVPVQHPSEFTEAETGAKHIWVHEGYLAGFIGSGRIKCAMTIAAWGILVARGMDKLPV